jgi:hypothetical protein
MELKSLTKLYLSEEVTAVSSGKNNVLQLIIRKMNFVLGMCWEYEEVYTLWMLITLI